ncbi:hypothetical protein ACF0H5_003955 [Mactra antiquata]
MILKERWNNVCRKLKIPANLVDEYWMTIQTKYSESHRYYHTLKHLEDMFIHYDDIYDQLQSPVLVALAIFFHDIIYEPKRPDNEEVSAELFKKFAEIFDAETLDKYSPQTVYDWIIATKKHETEVHRSPDVFGTDDIHYFLDMDMSILGVNEDDYKVYADRIRQEYIHIPEDIFKHRRAQVLRSFLQIQNIYATEIFRTKHEQRARSNIEAEITRLESTRLEDKVA